MSTGTAWIELPHYIKILIFMEIGICLGLGFRLVQWTIPKPATRIILCYANEVGELPVCRPLEPLAKKKGVKHGK